MLDKQPRIAIIGGGLTGLVTGAELKKKGYRDVTVFEKEGQLGGKLHTIKYKGRAYELGANFGLPSQKTLKALMKRYHIKPDGPQLARVNYDANGQETSQIPKEKLGDFIKELEALPVAIAQYPSLNNTFLHGIEDELAMPFSKWCDVHGFDVLKTVFIHYFTIFGLGDIEKVPALYVLKILNYDNLMSFMELPEFITWNEGVETLVNALAQDIPHIKLNQPVEYIDVLEDAICVHTKYEQLHYDHVVIAAPLECFSYVFSEDLDLKKDIESIRYQHFNVYAFTGKNITKACICLLENLRASRNGHTVIFDSRWETPDGDGMVIVYAYSPPDHSKVTAIQMIKEDLMAFGISDLRFYQGMHWKHCPYVDTDTIQGQFYDKLHHLQGKHSLYYAGEIMSTLSMENSIKYAQNLVNTYF